MTTIMKAAANMTITAAVTATDHQKKAPERELFLYVNIKILLYAYKDFAKKMVRKRCTIRGY